MDFKEFITKSNTRKEYHRPRIVCNDGFNMSVQCGRGNYCTPREDNEDYYSAAEIGFPSHEETLINEYEEDNEQLTQTVYGWVPSGIIDEVILKHGGINVSETFNKK